MKYESVEACADEFPVYRVCEVLNVSESGYYAWQKRPPSQREQDNQTLSARIEAIWKEFKHCLWYPSYSCRITSTRGMCR